MFEVGGRLHLAEAHIFLSVGQVHMAFQYQAVECIASSPSINL